MHVLHSLSLVWGDNNHHKKRVVLHSDDMLERLHPSGLGVDTGVKKKVVLAAMRHGWMEWKVSKSQAKIKALSLKNISRLRYLLRRSGIYQASTSGTLYTEREGMSLLETKSLYCAKSSKYWHVSQPFWTQWKICWKYRHCISGIVLVVFHFFATKTPNNSKPGKDVYLYT